MRFAIKPQTRKAEINRHKALAKAELAAWTDSTSIRERLAKVERDEGEVGDHNVGSRTLCKTCKIHS